MYGDLSYLFTLLLHTTYCIFLSYASTFLLLPLAVARESLWSSCCHLKYCFPNNGWCYTILHDLNKWRLHDIKNKKQLNGLWTTDNPDHVWNPWQSHRHLEWTNLPFGDGVPFGLPHHIPIKCHWSPMNMQVWMIISLELQHTQIYKSHAQVTQAILSMDWFQGTSTGNHRFSHWIWGFPVKIFP